MALTPCTVATNNIATVGTNVAERALTTDQFKALFDKYGVDFVAWFNATHLAEGHMTESGSNASGSYIKFNDGTMVCYMTNTQVSRAFDGADVSGVRYVSDAVTYPAPFYSTPTVFSSLVITGDFGFIGKTEPSTASVALFACRIGTDIVSHAYIERILAVGRWKA